MTPGDVFHLVAQKNGSPAAQGRACSVTERAEL